MKPLFIIITILGLLSVVFTWPTFGKNSGGIIVNSADTVLQIDVLESQNLLAVLNMVTSRIVFENSNTANHMNLANIPPSFQSLLSTVTDRIIFEKANNSREIHLTYPTVLMNDTTLPQATNFTEEMVGSNQIKISWETNEFTDSIIEYSMSSGTYAQSQSNTLYDTNHSFILSGIQAGQTYYYRVHNSDLSGNVYHSEEMTFTAEFSIYLPFIQR